LYMAEVMKIIFKGGSGWGPSEEAYGDKVTITPNSIEYLYEPATESECNPKLKWSYRTSSPLFLRLYQEVAARTLSIMDDPNDVFCTDVGGIEINVSFSDRSKRKRRWFCTGDHFRECFSLIRQMVPGCESVPAVLSTNEDDPADGNQDE